MTETRYQPITRRTVDRLPQLQALPADLKRDLDVVSRVLPFRTNRYVVDELIDWQNAPDDPMYQLSFPQRGMLTGDDYARVAGLIDAGAADDVIEAAAREIQHTLNPHPAGQVELNVPSDGGQRVDGIQHKYRETVLFFPSQGQTCHAYCSYCFRWPQFVGLDELRFAAQEAEGLVRYLRAHPEVTSVLFTGGDPLIMRTEILRRYVEPLLKADLPHLRSIRIGTKSLAWWPQRFVTDRDADDLLKLFEEVIAGGRTLALMAHSSHPQELATSMAQQAISRVLGTGAVLRCQAPVIRGVNDDATTLSTLWTRQVQLGLVPYYLFVARDTGARRYFEVPLARAADLYRDAIAAVSGLARTVRGPSMSATPGKVVVDGVAEIHGERVFCLRFLQARDPAWVGRPFFARFDEAASWLDELTPAFGQARFFFADELDAMLRGEAAARPWGSSSTSGAGRLRILDSAA